MSRTYRTPLRATFFGTRTPTRDDFERERWWLTRHGVETYEHFLAYRRRDSKRTWMSIPSHCKRDQNRRHRAAVADALRHYDPDSSIIPPRGKGWSAAGWWW